MKRSLRRSNDRPVAREPAAGLPPRGHCSSARSPSPSILRGVHSACWPRRPRISRQGPTISPPRCWHWRRPRHSTSWAEPSWTSSAARLASWGGDPRVAPELLLRAAKQFEPLDVGLAQAVYLQAMAAACVAGNFARGAGIGDIARAAKSCPVSAAPTTGEWLVAGLARVTADGPAAAAPSLRRALQATPSDMIDGEGIHWLGYQCGAASVLWDHDSLHRLAALHVTATRGAGALTMLPWALNSLAHALTLEGDLEHAVALVVEADQILEATGNNFVSYVGALLAAWRADDDSLRSIRDHVATARAAGNALALKSAAMGECNPLQRHGAIRASPGRRHRGGPAAVGMGRSEPLPRTHRSGRALRTTDGRLRRARAPRGDHRTERQRLGDGHSEQVAARSSRTAVPPRTATAKRSIGWHVLRSGPNSRARTCCTANGCVGRTGGSKPASTSAPRTRCSPPWGSMASPSGRGTSCWPRARRFASARAVPSMSSLPRRHTSRGSRPRVARTRRSARNSSSVRARSNGTCARSSPSWESRHGGSFARRCLDRR